MYLQQVARNTQSSYLSQYFHDYWHHSILFGEALVGHVPGRPAGADENVSAGRLKGHVLHVGPHPAVGLTEHGLWSQSGSNQEDVFAFHAAVGRLALAHDFFMRIRVSSTVFVKMRVRGNVCFLLEDHGTLFQKYWWETKIGSSLNCVMNYTSFVDFCYEADWHGQTAVIFHS